MAIIRFVLRALSVIALAAATILAVLDATRTVAASKLVLTSLRQSWTDISPSSLAAAQHAITGHAPWLWDPVATTILALPDFLIFLVLALVLQTLGTRPKRFRGPSAI
jgi:hypothetical protein